MDGTLKKGLTVVFVLFVGWMLFTDPTRLADLAKAGGGALASGVGALFQAIAQFLDAVTH